MPNFTIPLQGGGEMHVNATDYAGAVQNVQGSGNTPAANASTTSTVAANTIYPATGGGQPAATTQTNQANSTSLQQLGTQINSLLGAIASGNKQAFDEAVRQFDVSFGLDQDKFNESIRQFNQNFDIAQSGVTGTYQGSPTQQAILQQANIAAQNAGLTGQFQGAPTLAAQAQYASEYGGNGMAPGQTTLAAQQQAYAQQLGLITQAASLQANPFRQQQAIGQMGRLLGGQGVAGFSAPQTVAGVGTAGGNQAGGMGYLTQMINDIQSPAANQTSMNDVLNGIPTPNKMNSVEFFKSAPSTQNLVLQGMQEKFGLDPQDSLAQMKQTLPGFQAPQTFGTVKKPGF